ncbi:unnamed protein product [Rotaria magnacalcarata]|uniref:FLYWCH-type domain-containing protein n=1 Tax=Rotaria magnacalcarata TaxID=392030 RepID=A0A816YY35_9BILA|nr:unnamed protein product [Rotaria magnacalcarata]CAF2174491.1 unnamed protein product [Rotaria magnacalcarata]CAF3893882.1 unnamed protein product [Rotaria magnacalcarata]CAF3941183.1 unnamed protein product [Rotaria magnacalcarata]
MNNLDVLAELASNQKPIKQESDSLNASFILKTTQKGKPCIILDGHRYKHRRDNLDGSMSWTCTHELCSASVRTYGDRVVRRNDGHLHARTLLVDPQQEFLSRLKKRAAEDTVTIPKIYDEELMRSINEHSIEIREHLPSFASVKSTLYRHRQRNQKLKVPNTDCKSSERNSLPPKKRPLPIDIDNEDEKRKKISSSTYPYNLFLAQNYMFMYAYASVLSSLQQQM